MKRSLSFRWIASSKMRYLLAVLMIVPVVFLMLLVGAYMSHSLRVAHALVVQRTENMAQSLQQKLKSLMVSAASLYEEQGAFNWLNSASIDSKLDIAMVQATGKYMQSNAEAIALVLYNKQVDRLYEFSRSNHKLYRDASTYPEAEILDIVHHPQEGNLQFQQVSYRGASCVALRLPHTVTKNMNSSALVFIFDPQAIASAVSDLLVTSPLDGSVTFITGQDGSLMMGSLPQGLPLQELAASSPLADSNWLTFLRTGYLAHWEPLRLQDWSVCSVLHVDSFWGSHMPFVKIILACTGAFIAILSLLFVIYTYLMQQPYFKLAVDLASRLPGNAQTVLDANGHADTLSALRQSINYLLQHAISVEATTQHQLLRSRFIAWVNTLGNEHPLEVELSAFFPHSQLQMGLIRMVDYGAQSPDYFARRSLRTEISNALRDALQRRFPVAYCVDTGDGTFALFVNGPTLDPPALMVCLEEQLTLLHAQLPGTLCGIVSSVLPSEDQFLSQTYQQLYKASLLGAGITGKTVFTLEEYMSQCATPVLADNQDALQQAIDEFIDIIHAGDGVKAEQAIEKLCALLDLQEEENRRPAIYALYIALFFHFGKQLEKSDYEKSQLLLHAGTSSTALKEHIRALFQKIQEHSMPSPATSEQWHSIILDISEYIQNNIVDPQLSVEIIAQKVGYSPNYIRSMFKMYVGVSISDYIRDRRLEIACKLLSESQMPITKVMENSGFTNKSSFFTLLKAKNGVTPSEYRARYTDQESFS